MKREKKRRNWILDCTSFGNWIESSWRLSNRKDVTQTFSTKSREFFIHFFLFLGGVFYSFWSTAVPICGWDLLDVSIEFLRKLHLPGFRFAINRRSPDHPLLNDPGFDLIVACGRFTIDDRDIPFSFHPIHHSSWNELQGVNSYKTKKKQTFHFHLLLMTDGEPGARDARSRERGASEEPKVVPHFHSVSIYGSVCSSHSFRYDPLVTFVLLFWL